MSNVSRDSPSSTAQSAKPSSLQLPVTTPSDGDILARARQDLSEAQRSKGVMQSRLQTVIEELQKLKLKMQMDSKLIGELTAERAILTTRMKDQDEELKGKGKLLEVRRFS